MAGFGGRHVFGAAGEKSDLPSMPLATMYVEANATWTKKSDEAETRPVLDFVRELIEEHRVVVVKAHFGHGKSLSARTLAYRWAEERIGAAAPSPDSWLPIIVKCGEDFSSHNDDLDRVVRAALWRHAASLGLGLASDDAAFAMPPDGWRTVVLIDGLDEVAFGPRELEALFRRMRERATDRRRFVVFSRPEVLPGAPHLDNIPVLELQPFTTDDGFGNPGGQVAGWIERWNRVARPASPISVPGLAERQLLALASTPILLFMIASTWGRFVSAREPPSLAQIYEGFFEHIARGKHKADADHHRPIAEASKQLCRALIARGEIPEGAEPPEAMLWVLSRVAWEQKRIEDGEWVGRAKRPLREFDVRKILREELEVDDTPEIEQTAYMGVLLALQADLALGRPRILFGHKSFREFLIARYWELRLRRIISAEGNERDAAEETLLGARLLEPDDRSFAFLGEMLTTWPLDERQRLFRWAEACFNDERPQRGARSFREDVRPLLREAALAIGSTVADERGIRAKDPRTLRSMLAWFWLQSRSLPMVVAAGLLSGDADLNEANLVGADLRRADLHAANLNAAILSNVHLDGACLRGASLISANMTGTTLSEADLAGADLRGAYLRVGDLRNADLSGADLIDANLIRADLGGANLRGAYLRGANLNMVSLRRADVRGANLRGANLSGADLREANLSGADLRGADLRGVDLRDADLSGAHFSGAYLTGVDLRGAHLSEANLEGVMAADGQRADFADAGVDEGVLDAIQWVAPAGQADPVEEEEPGVCSSASPW